jgi:uncharacterized MnhB-related membrane protein
MWFNPQISLISEAFFHVHEMLSSGDESAECDCLLGWLPPAGSRKDGQVMGDSAIYLILVVGAVICAYRAMTEARILSSTIYLACVSAAVAMMLYLLGAYQVAVIELSVGAGLVTVLLVYAISVVGDDASDPGPVIPRPVAVGLTLLTAVMLGYLAYSLPSKGLTGSFPPLLTALWEERVLDVWVQMVLIFAGVLGILGLLSEGTLAHMKAHGHYGNGHKTVTIAPPTACGFTGSDARDAEDLRKEKVGV